MCFLSRFIEPPGLREPGELPVFSSLQDSPCSPAYKLLEALLSILVIIVNNAWIFALNSSLYSSVLETSASVLCV